MEPMLLKMVIGLFIIGAIFGAVILAAVLRNKPTPKPVVFIHGAFVATALVLLLIAFFKAGQTGKLLEFSLGFFVIAALGGFTLFFIDMQKKPIPKLLAVLHPLLAATGLVLLIIYVLS
jgi:hypothetical protein